MPQFLIALTVILVIWWIAKNASRKEAKQYAEENSEPKEAQNLENVDSLNEVIIEFVFLAKKDQFMINSFPNILINGKEKYKMLDDKITLKLPSKFELHFGVPYLKGEAWKIDLSYNLKVGYKYKLTFKPKAFVFSKPKVTIQEVGLI
jgi:hypothetical protein